MNHRTTQSQAGKLTVAGLVVAAAGIATLLAVRIAPSTALVGIVLLLAVGGLVAVGPWRWTPIVALVLALFELVAALAAPGSTYRLTHPALLGGFAGMWLQMLGLVLACAAGIVATTWNYRTRSRVVSRQR
jgi:predicted outer membrane lipoprotein